MDSYTPQAPRYVRPDKSPGSTEEFVKTFSTLNIVPLPPQIVEAVEQDGKPRNISPEARKVVARDFLAG